MNTFFHSSLFPGGDRFTRWDAVLAGAAALLSFFLLTEPAKAQFDFSGARAAKIRTYPVKRENGGPLRGGDGMAQPAKVENGRPAGLKEFPAVPVNEEFPGGSILEGLQTYQKRDPTGFLGPLLAILENGYLELDIEKRCHIDAIKIEYEHQPTKEAPSFQKAGLAALMQVVADGVMAADLFRARERLKNRYNSGLSSDPKGDQDAMEVMQALRLSIATRYSPRIPAKKRTKSSPRRPKERFKAEVARGKPAKSTLIIGPLRVLIRAKLERHKKRPPPKGC